MFLLSLLMPSLKLELEKHFAMGSYDPVCSICQLDILAQPDLMSSNGPLFLINTGFLLVLC